jgi:nucleosome binding factor SPN SPT16 subunit
MTKKLMDHFSDAMSGYIDSNAKITHEKLGEEIESKLEDPKFWKKLNLKDGVRLLPLSPSRRLI